MPDGDGSSEHPTLGAFGYLAAIVCCCVIVGGLTYNLGRHDERRHEAPAAYAKAAKGDAQNACVGRQGTAAFECIYEIVEAAQEQARGEQDLTAQQVAANSTFMSALIAFCTLIVTGIGAWLIRQTLIATQGAVREAKNATAAAHEAVRETTRIGEAQVRAYLSVKPVCALDHDDALKFIIEIRNSGQSPARNAQAVFNAYAKVAKSEERYSFPCSWKTLGDISAGERTEIEFKIIPDSALEERFLKERVSFDIEIDINYETVVNDIVETEEVRYNAAFGHARAPLFNVPLRPGTKLGALEIHVGHTPKRQRAI